jgi:hypothetical protein
MDKSAAAAADDVERGDYEQEHERTGACVPVRRLFPFLFALPPCFGRFFASAGIGQRPLRFWRRRVVEL